MRAKSRLAMTLIEVVGGLALLGTLLVAVLLAKAKFTRQAATADRKLQAVAAADELLTVWRQDPNALPRDGSGPVAGDRQLSWRTRTVANREVAALGAQTVRLEVLDDRAAGAVLATVEIVVEPLAPAGGGNAAGMKADTGNRTANTRKKATAPQPKRPVPQPVNRTR
jgi:type II secretory pathway pseudopilin PulG